MWQPLKARRERKEAERRNAEEIAMTWYAPALESLKTNGGWNVRYHRDGTPYGGVILKNEHQKNYGPGKVVIDGEPQTIFIPASGSRA
jgi:hypothetical protein